MPRVKTKQPNPSREKGQRSLSLPLYLQRHLPYWGNPKSLEAKMWRDIVRSQPVAIICRETLIANLMALEWKIEPRDSTKRDEYKDEIDYYTKLLENDGDYDWTDRLEWICGDLLDIPFGGTVELGRQGDKPEGKVMWIEPLDGATLFPTLNKEYPVGQTLPELANKTIYFPNYAINRMYYSPRRDIRQKGWGMPPPEIVYLSLELLNRGDVYYANLLIDTPAAGILDLGDMAKDSAEEWVEAWRDMLTGIDPFKIPVLYEHEKAVDWIEFTKSPVELMFDTATLKYASLVSAGYGMSLGDIGFPSASGGGDTLAGTIRQERRTRRTGFAKLKKKTKYFWDRMLPEYLEFHFIDLDDELSVALGRARLATSTAWQQMTSARLFTPDEGRQQMMADGLITISVPEKLPEGAFDDVMMDGDPNERPNQLGRPVSPSQGGHGEVVVDKMDAFGKSMYRAGNIDGLLLERLAYTVFPIIRTETAIAIEELSEIYTWKDWHDDVIFNKITDSIPEVTKASIETSLFSMQKSLASADEKIFVINKDEAISDVREIIYSIYKEMKETALKQSFVRGEIDEISEEVESEMDAFEDDIINFVDDFEAEAIDMLNKSIISGIYTFSVFHPDIEDLDETHPDLILFIRSSIDKTCEVLIDKFGGKISDIILNNSQGDERYESD